MVQQPEVTDERRTANRFPMRLPVTLRAEGRSITALTRDVSAKGVYFVVAGADSALVENVLEFTMEFPPEITLCNSMKVSCTGRVVRKQNLTHAETGVAAEISRYSFLQAAETS